MSILITIVIYLVIFGLVWWAIDLMPLPFQVKRWIQVLVLMILIMFVATAIPGVRNFNF